MTGSSKMRLVAAVILLLVAAVVWLGLHHIHGRERVLAGGSVLRLARVNFGKEQPYHITNSREDFEEWAKKWLPKSWSQKWFIPRLVTPMGSRTSWSMVSVSHTNMDALWMYLTRRTPGSTNYQTVDIYSAELLDSHGCRFVATRMGGFDDGRLAQNSVGARRGRQGTVEWLAFEAFPRHEKDFRLQLYDERHNLLTEFTVENPARTPIQPTDWPIQPLPISKTANGVTFVLADVVIKPDVATAKLTFNYLENGAPSTAWKALDAELWDSSGNFAPKIWPDAAATRLVSLDEPAWKLRVKFYGVGNTAAASNFVWTIAKVKVPAAGEYVELDEKRRVGLGQVLGQVDLLALAGPGKVIYSNGVPIKATSELPERDGLYPVTAESSSTSFNSGGRSWATGASYTLRTVRLRTPHIAMYAMGLTNDERLTICATDDQGRSFYARNWAPRYGAAERKAGEINYLQKEFGTGPSFYQLDLPEGCKMVDLTLCIHYPVVEDFVFKPPAK